MKTTIAFVDENEQPFYTLVLYSDSPISCLQNGISMMLGDGGVYAVKFATQEPEEIDETKNN
jgi:hypothetical protein